MSTRTPSRKEQREAARAERQRREQEAALQAQRKRRLTYLGVGLAAVIAVVAIVMAVASGGSSSSKTAAGGSAVSNVGAVKREFAGVPQKGTVLGSPSAKATMMVFADMQCPFCKEFDTQALPTLVQRYVKTGKLKVVFQPIAILGSDSVIGARAVGAAAQQNKLYPYASLFYYNQGPENTGYVTDAYLTKLAKATPGLNVAKWRADLNSNSTSALLSRAQTAANTAQVNSTPTFLVGKSGQPLTKLQVDFTSPQAFYGKLDALTK